MTDPSLCLYLIPGEGECLRTAGHEPPHDPVGDIVVPMSFFDLGPPPTPEEIAAREAEEVAKERKAVARLRALLIADGAPEAAVDEVIPSLMRQFKIRLDRNHGTLTVGGMLMMGGYPGSPPGHTYEALDLRTPWTPAQDDAPST